MIYLVQFEVVENAKSKISYINDTQMNIDVIEILNNDALDEQEKYKTFKVSLEEYCSEEHGILNLFRFFKTVETDLKGCLKDTTQVNVDKLTVKKFLNATHIELRIIRYKIQHPELANERITGKFPVGEWTDNKADLIELVYAISLVHSVEHGKVSTKAIKEAFEYIFGVDLGNIHDRLNDIACRKGARARYLEKLLDGMNKYLDDVDAR